MAQRRNAPLPQLRDPAQPHSSGCHALNIIQRAPCRRGRHTLPQARSLPVFSFWVIFTYSLQMEKSIVPCSSNTTLLTLQKKSLNNPFSLVFSVSESNVHNSPFFWKRAAKFPLEIVVLVFLFHPASSLKSFPSLVQISTPYLSWLSKVGLIKQCKNEIRGKDTTETLLR